MSKEIPIIFSTTMVQAIVEGRKTQTRRVVKYRKKIENPIVGFSTFTNPEHFSVRGKHEDGSYGESFFKLPYQKGDRLWVRETCLFLQSQPTNGWIYKADDNQGIETDLKKNGYRWRPSIHMPKAAARIWLEIERVRVQRLQYISEEGVIAEGVRCPVTKSKVEGMVSVLWSSCENSAHSFMPKGWEHLPEKEKSKAVLFAHWAELWCNINGRESWDSNPWVWVIEFKVLSTTGKPELFGGIRDYKFIEQ